MKIHRRLVATLATPAALALAVAAASTVGSTPLASAATTGRAASHLTVAVSVPQEIDPYFIAITDYFKKEAQAHGYKVLTANANGSVATQVNQVKTFVTDGVSAIAIDSINDQTIVPAIKFANQHNIPVFTIDTAPYANAMKAEGAHIVQTVESNNYQCGTTSSREMLAWLHGRPAVVGKVILPLAQSTVTRNAAMEREIAGHHNVKVVASVNGEAQYDVALTATEQMLSGHPNINVIWTTDGPAATGAVRAIIGKHLVGKVHLFGNATVVPADQAIESGKVMIAGATQFPSIEGATVGYDMWQYLSGHHNQAKVEYTPCNAVTHANAKAVTAYNTAVFSGSGKEPVQVLLHGKFYEPQSNGKLKRVVLP
jgi:ribose transport system substrate-binding protein